MSDQMVDAWCCSETIGHAFGVASPQIRLALVQLVDSVAGDELGSAFAPSGGENAWRTLTWGRAIAGLCKLSK